MTQRVRVIKLLARTLKVSRSSIEITSGQTSRQGRHHVRADITSGQTSRRKQIVIATDDPDQISSAVKELAAS